MLRVGIVAGVFALAACGGLVNQSSEGRADGGATTTAGRVPMNHRPNADQCAAPAPAVNCMGGNGMLGGDFPCSNDSDCTAGINGRCLHGGGPTGCSCSYDACTQDSDCSTGLTCACRGSPYNSIGNTCVAGDCRVDADCGPAGYCSPVATSAGFCESVVGYYCHTPNDLCVNDSDCPSGNGPNFPSDGFCEYSTTSSRWECEIAPVCQ